MSSLLAQPVVTQSVEPLASIIAMVKAVMGQGEEGPISGLFYPVTHFDSFLDSHNRISKPSGAIQ